MPFRSAPRYTALSLTVNVESFPISLCAEIEPPRRVLSQRLSKS
jgi:hypothetical protein